MTNGTDTGKDDPARTGGSAGQPANKGFAALAGDDFSVLGAVGGVRGAIESVLPSLVFIVLFVITADLRPTLIVTVAVCAVEFVGRLVRREPVKSVLMGTALVALCLVWAWKSHDAKNFYMPGFLINAFWLVVLAGTLIARVPGIGAMVEFFRQPPSYLGMDESARDEPTDDGDARDCGPRDDGEGLGDSMRGWLDGWRSDRALWRAYTAATALWVGVFALRLGVEVPLYLAQNVAWLGTMRILLGMPLFALAIWATWLIVATPIQRHAAAARDADAPDPAQD